MTKHLSKKQTDEILKQIVKNNKNYVAKFFGILFAYIWIFIIFIGSISILISLTIWFLQLIGVW